MTSGEVDVVARVVDIESVITHRDKQSEGE